MDRVSSEANSKKVLIFGDFSLESVEDKIIALGYTFQIISISKLFTSKEFEKDLKQFSVSTELLAIFFFLREQDVLKLSYVGYTEFWHDLLFSLKTYPSLIFIENNDFLEITQYPMENGLTPIEQMIIECLNYINKNIELIKNIISLDKYKNAEQLIKEMNFIGDLSIYINNNRIKIEYSSEHKSELRSGLVSSETRVEDISERDIFLHLQPLLEEIGKIRKKIRKSLNEENQEKIQTYLVRKEKQLEPLSEQFVRELNQLQRNLIELRNNQLQQFNQLIKILQESDVEIVFYKTRQDISLRVHYFLDEIDKGIFLHLYIPNGRYQGDQLASFLHLFESYLQRVEHVQFSIETRKTLHG